MYKVLMLLLVVLSLSSCKDKVMYVDSTTGKVVAPPVSSVEHITPKVVCVEGVQYYIYTSGYQYMMTPRVKLDTSSHGLRGYSC